MQKLKLAGLDGNAFAILARAHEALKKAKQEDKIKEFDAKAKSGDYDNLLRVCFEYFDVE